LIEPLPVPLREDETGTIRVGQTRVSLDLVTRAHQDGATPEEIVRRYDTLRLADVYAVIGYYLTHRDTVDAYLDRREEEAEKLKRRIEATHPPRPGFWEELEARLRGKDGLGVAGIERERNPGHPAATLSVTRLYLRLSRHGRTCPRDTLPRR
jgi:uncharacterized protein (DUF433 family)